MQAEQLIHWFVCPTTHAWVHVGTDMSDVRVRRPCTCMFASPRMPSHTERDGEDTQAMASEQAAEEQEATNAKIAGQCLGHAPFQTC